MPEAEDAFLEGYRKRPHKEPAPSLPHLLELAKNPTLDPTQVAEALATLVDRVCIVVDLRPDGPMASRMRIPIEEVALPLEELSTEQQRLLASLLLAPLRASGGNAAIKALVERLPG